MLADGRDILVFRGRELLFARRNAKWKRFNQEILNKSIGDDINQQLKDTVYKGLLDATFAYHGAGILILDKTISELLADESNYLTNYFDLKYIVNDELYAKYLSSDTTQTKQTALRRLLVTILTKRATICSASSGKSYKSINRRLFNDLLQIDGSLVVDKNGVLIAVGAIIKKLVPIDGKGARSAAANGSSEIGYAIKVSEDGEITAYYKKMPIFKLG